MFSHSLFFPQGKGVVRCAAPFFIENIWIDAQRQNKAYICIKKSMKKTGNKANHVVVLTEKDEEWVQSVKKAIEEKHGIVLTRSQIVTIGLYLFQNLAASDMQPHYIVKALAASRPRKGNPIRKGAPLPE